MSDDEMNKFSQVIRAVVREEVAPLDKKVTGLNKKVTDLDEKVGSLDTKVTGLDTKVTSLDTKVGSLDVKFTSLTEQVVNLTEKVEGEIIPTLKNHTNYFKKMMAADEKNKDNINRLDKRLSETEGRLGIQPTPESHIIK